MLLPLAPRCLSRYSPPHCNPNHTHPPTHLPSPTPLPPPPGLCNTYIYYRFASNALLTQFQLCQSKQVGCLFLTGRSVWVYGGPWVLAAKEHAWQHATAGRCHRQGTAAAVVVQSAHCASPAAHFPLPAAHPLPGSHSAPAPPPPPAGRLHQQRGQQELQAGGWWLVPYTLLVLLPSLRCAAVQQSLHFLPQPASVGFPRHAPLDAGRPASLALMRGGTPLLLLSFFPKNVYNLPPHPHPDAQVLKAPPKYSRC